MTPTPAPSSALERPAPPPAPARGLSDRRAPAHAPGAGFALPDPGPAAAPKAEAGRPVTAKTAPGPQSLSQAPAGPEAGAEPKVSAEATARAQGKGPGEGPGEAQGTAQGEAAIDLPPTLRLMLEQAGLAKAQDQAQDQEPGAAPDDPDTRAVGDMDGTAIAATGLGALAPITDAAGAVADTSAQGDPSAKTADETAAAEPGLATDEPADTATGLAATSAAMGAAQAVDAQGEKTSRAKSAKSALAEAAKATATAPATGDPAQAAELGAGGALPPGATTAAGPQATPPASGSNRFEVPGTPAVTVETAGPTRAEAMGAQHGQPLPGLDAPTALSLATEAPAPAQPIVAPPAAATPLPGAATPVAAPPPQPAPLPLTHPDWPAQLVQEIGLRKLADGDMLEITLTPERLGALHLRMELREGVASITIVTETPEAARLFTEGQQRLAEQFARAGLELGSHSASTGSGRDNRDAPAQGAPGQGGGANDTPEALILTLPQGAQHRVDILA